MARVKPLPPADIAEPSIVDEAERAVRAAGSLPLPKLTRAKLSAAGLADLADRLAERGLERTAKVVRVPIEAQVRALVEGGQRVPHKAAAKRVKGATGPEIKGAIDRLCRAGLVKVVIRTQVEVLVGAGEGALDADQIAALARLNAQLTAVLKKLKVKGSPRTLLRDDLTAMLVPLGVAAAAPSADDDPRALVLDAVRRLEDPQLLLVRIPAICRALLPRVSLAAIHRALLAEAEAGTLELRPEAGGEFLGAADAALCPPGPRSTVFSYARRLTP